MITYNATTTTYVILANTATVGSPYSVVSSGWEIQLNHTSVTPPNTEYQMPYSLPVSIVIGILLCAIIFMAISGNILVCIAIFTDTNLKKLSNYFLVSLAIADLWVAGLVMTFAVANDILGYWPFDMGFCNIWIAFDILSATASILNLCAISFDRYLHIQNSLTYDSKMTQPKVFGMIAGVWLLSAILSFLPIFIGGHASNADSSDASTPTEDPATALPMCFLELSPIYAVISSIISFYLPCIVMLTLYFKLYTIARKAVTSIKRSQTCNSTISNDSSKVNKSKVSDHKAAITLGIISGVFLACWVPFFIVNIVKAFCPSCIGGLLFSSLTWLGYFNSMLNPIIYSIFNRDFRDAFKKTLNCKRCRRSSFCQNKILRIVATRKNNNQNCGQTPKKPLAFNAVKFSELASDNKTTQQIHFYEPDGSSKMCENDTL